MVSGIKKNVQSETSDHKEQRYRNDQSGFSCLSAGQSRSSSTHASHKTWSRRTNSQFSVSLCSEHTYSDHSWECLPQPGTKRRGEGILRMEDAGTSEEDDDIDSQDSNIPSTAVEQVVACALVTQRARVRSPVGTSFRVRFFWGFSSPVRWMSGSFRPTRSPNIIWPS